MDLKAVCMLLALSVSAPGPNALSPEALADALLSGRIDPMAYDYGALKDRPDAKTYIEAASKRVGDSVRRNHSLGQGVSQIAGCTSPSEQAVGAGLRTALKAGSHAEWLEARRQADAAYAKHIEIRDALLAGGAAPFEDYKGVVKDVRLAREASDPAAAELFRRAARDQAARFSFSMHVAKSFAKGLSTLALHMLDGRVTLETCGIDRDNRQWLKDMVSRRGWFRVSRDGAEADHTAWLIVQHADEDVRFQQQILAMLESLSAAGESSKSDYAYLYDRVAVNTGRPQRYATQGACKGPGDWEPKPLEDAAKVDELRAEAGIDWKLADYKVLMNGLCR